MAIDAGGCIRELVGARSDLHFPGDGMLPLFIKDPKTAKSVLLPGANDSLARTTRR
jgi:hypothetical protein